MQLEGATELERRTYDLCQRVETELPASELATSVVVALSDAGRTLQELRGYLRRVEVAALRGAQSDISADKSDWIRIWAVARDAQGLPCGPSDWDRAAAP